MELALTHSDIMKDATTTLPLRVVPSSAPSPDTDDDDTEDESEDEDQQSEAVCAVWRAWNNGKEVPRWGVAEIQKMSPSTTGR